MESQVSVKEAYVAMHLFLTELYEKHGFDQLGGILGSMCLLEDGSSADPACWNDWLRMVEKSRQLKSISLIIKDDYPNT